MTTKRKPRICVKCKDVLGRQRTWHTTSQPTKNKYGGTQTWCDGPKTTPGLRPYLVRAAIHYRNWASTGSVTACGLHGGRMRGAYKDAEAQVPYGRIKVDLAQTTCELCLALIAERCEALLLRRLGATGVSRDANLAKAHAQVAMHGLGKLVSA